MHDDSQPTPADGQHRAPVRPVDDLSMTCWAPGHEVRARVAPERDAGMPVEVLLRVEPHSDILYVSLHGAIDRAKYQPPRFEWLTTLRARSHNAVCVADSTLELSSTMTLGWYLGTERYDLTARIADVLESVRSQLGIRRTVLFGSSGGGFAAAQLAHRIPGSLGLAFSPQVRLARFYRLPDAVRAAAFPGSGALAEWESRHRPRVDLAARYRDSPPAGHLWYIQNTNDAHHVATHWRPFERQVGTAQGKVTYFELPYGDGHVPPSRQLLLRFLDAAATESWSPSVST